MHTVILSFEQQTTTMQTWSMIASSCYFSLYVLRHRYHWWFWTWPRWPRWFLGKIALIFGTVWHSRVTFPIRDSGTMGGFQASRSQRQTVEEMYSERMEENSKAISTAWMYRMSVMVRSTALRIFSTFLHRLSMRPNQKISGILC